MVAFKNRYMVVEVNLNPNKNLITEDPIIITQYNVTNAIKDSILVNFGQCGLASSIGSLQVKYVNPITKVCVIRASRQEYQKVLASITMVKSIGNSLVTINLLNLTGSIRVCREETQKCEESKFEHLKLVAGASQSAELSKQMQGFLDKVKLLEH